MTLEAFARACQPLRPDCGRESERCACAHKVDGMNDSGEIRPWFLHLAQNLGQMQEPGSGVLGPRAHCPHDSVPALAQKPAQRRCEIRCRK